MAEGLLEYEASLNAQGIPRWIAHDADREWDIDEQIDNVESALGRAQKEYQGNEHVDPGLRLIPVEKKPQNQDQPS